MKWLIAVCLVALTGCATVPPAQVKPPASLMTKCLPLNKLGGITGKDMLQNIVANASVYHECADKHSKLIEALTKP